MRRRVVKPKRITAAWLKTTGACEEEVDNFRRKFPRGLSITVGSYIKAIDAGFYEEMEWLLENVMGKRAKIASDTSYAETDREWERGYNEVNNLWEDGEISKRERKKRLVDLSEALGRVDAVNFLKLWNKWKGRKKR